MDWMTSKPDAFTLPKNSKQNWDYRIMAWSVLWSDKSKKQLKKLDKKIAGRIIDGVEDIKISIPSSTQDNGIQIFQTKNG